MPKVQGNQHLGSRQFSGLVIVTCTDYGHVLACSFRSSSIAVQCGTHMYSLHGTNGMWSAHHMVGPHTHATKPARVCSLRPPTPSDHSDPTTRSDPPTGPSGGSITMSRRNPHQLPRARAVFRSGRTKVGRTDHEKATRGYKANVKPRTP